MTSDPAASRGLRESKKERTRAALTDAALDLVIRHGYEATTVEAIARAADVSVRTFHNYFPGKAAALTHLAVDLLREFGTELAAQPDDLDCATAIRGSWAVMLERYHDRTDDLRALIDAIETNSELRSRLEYQHPDARTAVVTEMGRRLGADPATSAVPHVATEIALSTAVTLTRLLGAPGFADRSPDHLLDEAFSTLSLLVSAGPTDSPI